MLNHKKEGRNLLRITMRTNASQYLVLVIDLMISLGVEQLKTKSFPSSFN
jgi:hypothetical protein